MTIGERIKKRRIELGLTVDEVASSLNKNRATIYRYESDDIENFPTTVLEPLANILKTTPSYLMGWKKPTPSYSAELLTSLQNALHISSDNGVNIGQFEHFLENQLNIDNKFLYSIINDVTRELPKSIILKIEEYYKNNYYDDYVAFAKENESPYSQVASSLSVKNKDNNDYTEKETELLKMYRKLPNDVQNEVFAEIKGMLKMVERNSCTKGDTEEKAM